VALGETMTSEVFVMFPQSVSLHRRPVHGCHTVLELEAGKRLPLTLVPDEAQLAGCFESSYATHKSGFYVPRPNEPGGTTIQGPHLGW
jgi:hypothetical protein